VQGSGQLNNRTSGRASVSFPLCPCPYQAVSDTIGAIVPARMGRRIAEVKDRIEEMRRAELEVEKALQTRRLEPIDPKVVMQPRAGKISGSQ